MQLPFRFIFFLLSLSGAVAAEAVRTDKLQFPIPFQITEEAQRETAQVELLFSPNFGRQWFSYTKVQPNTGAVHFAAPAEGEYWFIFRTHLKNGEIREPQSLAPQLRIIVDTSPPAPPVAEKKRKTPAATSATTATQEKSDPFGGTPITPPRELTATSEKKRDVPTNHVASSKTQSESQIELQKETQSDSQKKTDSLHAKKNDNTSENIFSQLPILAPARPDAVRWISETSKTTTPRNFSHGSVDENRDGISDDALAELAANMLPHYLSADARRSTSAPRAATEYAVEYSEYAEKVTTSATAINSNTSAAPGTIQSVSLIGGETAKKEKSKLIVKWSIPSDTAFAAQYRVDILKGETANGPWRPLVIYYENSGEYWWYVSADDFTPFYLALRTRSSDSREVCFDQTAIPIKLPAE